MTGAQRAVAAILAALATSVLLMAPGSPASAAAGCYADTCQGKDPSATNCNADGRTLDSRVSSRGVLVRLRWSPTCRAAWARIDRASPGDRVRVQRPETWPFRDFEAATVAPGQTSVHTRMINDLAPRVAQACGRDITNGELTCTDFF